MSGGLQSAGVSVVASSALASGVLTGKYRGANPGGRVGDQLEDPRYQRALRVADNLQVIASRLGQPPAALAIAYALANPLVASVLVGATSAEQVEQNTRALIAVEQLSESVLTELRATGA
jgi:L-glyceraldehyde 3-phosphate reductase